MQRRNFLGGMLAALAAPAIIRSPSLLMPVVPALMEMTFSYWIRASPDGPWEHRAITKMIRQKEPVIMRLESGEKWGVQAEYGVRRGSLLVGTGP